MPIGRLDLVAGNRGSSAHPSTAAWDEAAGRIQQHPKGGPLGKLGDGLIFDQETRKSIQVARSGIVVTDNGNVEASISLKDLKSGPKTLGNGVTIAPFNNGGNDAVAVIKNGKGWLVTFDGAGSKSSTDPIDLTDAPGAESPPAPQQGAGNHSGGRRAHRRSGAGGAQRGGGPQGAHANAASRPRLPPQYNAVMENLSSLHKKHENPGERVRALHVALNLLMKSMNRGLIRARFQNFQALYEYLLQVAGELGENTEAGKALVEMAKQLNDAAGGNLAPNAPSLPAPSGSRLV